jgi:hypothetical protein
VEVGRKNCTRSRGKRMRKADSSGSVESVTGPLSFRPLRSERSKAAEDTEDKGKETIQSRPPQTRVNMCVHPCASASHSPMALCSAVT